MKKNLEKSMDLIDTLMFENDKFTDLADIVEHITEWLDNIRDGSVNREYFLDAINQLNVMTGVIKEQSEKVDKMLDQLWKMVGAI